LPTTALSCRFDAQVVNGAQEAFKAKLVKWLVSEYNWKAKKVRCRGPRPPPCLSLALPWAIMSDQGASATSESKRSGSALSQSPL